MKRCTVIILLMLFSIHTAYAYSTQERRWIDAVGKTYGNKAAQRVRDWRTSLHQYRPFPIRLQLKKVNVLMNKMYFVSDRDLWGQDDYWATPLEFLGARGGDSEDFTIAKYFSLLDLGVSDKKLRLVYVKAIKLNQFHMVLAYYATPASDPLILDNLNPQIRPASQRQDLLPIYSFNGKNLWLINDHSDQLASEASNLSHWNEVRARQRALVLKKPIINYDE